MFATVKCPPCAPRIPFNVIYDILYNCNDWRIRDVEWNDVHR